MGKHDPAPGLLAKLLVAFCLAMIAAVTASGFVNMASTIDRSAKPYATDCEMVAELCEEQIDE